MDLGMRLTAFYITGSLATSPWQSFIICFALESKFCLPAALPNFIQHCRRQWGCPITVGIWIELGVPAEFRKKQFLKSHQNHNVFYLNRLVVDFAHSYSKILITYSFIFLNVKRCHTIFHVSSFILITINRDLK